MMISEIIHENKILGNNISNSLLNDLQFTIQKQQQKQQRNQFKQPKLAIILTGNNPASLSYINKKIQIANKIGIQTNLIKIKAIDLIQANKQISQTIKYLNNDNSHHGILVQLPLIDSLKDKQQLYLNLIQPQKDVDCLTKTNLIQLQKKGLQATVLPCTPYGVMAIIKECQIQLKGKSILVIGRGKLTGNPLAKILLKQGYDIKIADRSNTREEISNLGKNSDIIFSATGYRDILGQNDIKDGAIIIDIGICNDQLDPNKIRGDIAQQVKMKKSHLYTPVPGGVGPMTVYSLMWNVYKLWSFQKNKIDL